MNESLELYGTLDVAGTRGYSAYEIAQQQGYTGTEEEWLESLVGPEGPRGPEGPEGPEGPIGLTPAFRIGSVTTLASGDNATASITGTSEIPILNLGLPRGLKGDMGPVGTNDYAEATNKPKINNVTLLGNKTLDELGIQAKGTYATVDYVNGLIGDLNDALDAINGEVI